LLDSFHIIAEKIRSYISKSEGTIEIESESFNRLARELFKFQFDNNLPYRRFCERRGISPQISNYTEIPAIPATAFKEFDLSVFSTELRTRVFHSSGTTLQKPSRHFHSADSIRLYEDSLAPWFKHFVLPDLDQIRLISLTPRANEAPNSSLVQMFETVTARFGDAYSAFFGHLSREGAWDIDFEALLKFISESQESGVPLLLCGTAFSFVHLCDELGSRTITLPTHARIFETGGYKGRSRSLPKEQLHALISARLGVSTAMIICEYGMSEISSQAYDRVAGKSTPRLFRFPHWVRVEFISPETLLPVPPGEPGLIRIYDLANAGSVMAIQTEDFGRSLEDGFELLGRAALAESRGCSLMSLE